MSFTVTIHTPLAWSLVTGHCGNLISVNFYGKLRDQITDDGMARQAPESQSIIRLLLAELAAREDRVMARIVKLEAEVAALKRT